MNWFIDIDYLYFLIPIPNIITQKIEKHDFSLFILLLCGVLFKTNTLLFKW